MHLTITDHFGMDENDMLKFRPVTGAFESWYWLQHGKKYNPFRTKLYYRIKMSGRF